MLLCIGIIIMLGAFSSVVVHFRHPLIVPHVRSASHASIKINLTSFFTFASQAGMLFSSILRACQSHNRSSCASLITQSLDVLKVQYRIRCAALLSFRSA